MKRFILFLSISAFLFCFSTKTKAQTIVIGPVTGSISGCEGSAAIPPNIQQFTVTGSNLAGNITLNAPVNFELSLAAGSGYSSNLALARSGGTVGSTIVYVRSSAIAPTGPVTGNIIISTAGAADQTAQVAGIITPLATVNPIPDQTIPNSEPVSAAHFTGTGNYFKWVNDTPGIGLPASGIGDIGSFTAINTGSQPITATITVTPYFAGSLYVGSDGYSDVTVINSMTKKVVTRIKVGLGPESVAVRPDGSMVYYANFDSNTVSVIGTGTNTVVATVPSNNTPWGICITPDGSKLYVAGAYGKILVIDALTYKQLASVQTGIGAIGITASPNGKYIYVGGTTATQGTDVRDQHSYQYRCGFNAGKGDQPSGIAVTPDNSEIYTANYWSGTVSAMNAATNKVVATISVGYLPTGVTISPDGKYAYVANEYSNSVSVINTATNQQETQIAVGQHPFGVSLSPDGGTLYALNSYSCNVSVVDVARRVQTDSIMLEGYANGPTTIGNFVTTGMCSGNPIKFTITATPAPPPLIIAESDPGPLTTTYGTPSPSASFIVSARILMGVVSVKPATWF